MSTTNDETTESGGGTEPGSGAEFKIENGTAGAKVRSETPYPYYSLTKGIAVVEAIRRAGGSEAFSSDVMKEMGVTKTTDRVWAYGIPSASQFGLIERVGRGDEGRIKLTDLATRIVLPATPEEARLAKVAAFKKPDLYVNLLAKFTGHPVPAKDGLKNILLRDFKIVESMVTIAADAFLESLKEAELVSPNNVIQGASGPDAHREQSGIHQAEDERGQPGRVEERQRDDFGHHREVVRVAQEAVAARAVVVVVVVLELAVLTLR